MADILSVAPRPPTPPRSSTRVDVPIDTELIITNAQQLFDTPDESPASQSASVSGSGRTRKRVDFSPWAPPIFTPSSVRHLVRPLPPSRECKSSSSILKMSSQPNPPTSPEAPPIHSYDNLTDMLKSIMQQLAVGSRSTSLDAYATLAGTLKAYNDIPEGAKLKEQLQSLCKYIRRDLQQESSEIGAADSNIITSALKVAVILVWDKSFSLLLTDEFRAFLLDRCSQALEDTKTPKSVVLHYIHLLATQNFRANIMTKARANRFLDALRTVTERVTGKNVIAERYMAYRKFTDQAPTVMKDKEFWLEDLMEGMCSNVNEIRNRALEFGVAVSTTFDSSAAIARDLKKLLNRQINNEQNYAAQLTRRLMKLIEVEGEGCMVPKIWAVTVRLLRGNNLQQFENSRHLKALLLVIQKCFNSTSAEIRSSAYRAWSQFIFIVRPSEKTPEQLRKMLLSPIAPQLNRADVGHPHKSNRTSAASAYYCLLYYSFRPSASHEQYTRLYKAYISNFWTDPFLAVPTNIDRACRVLNAIFWNEKAKFWTDARVNEPGTFEPDDLPRVDCKWVRKTSKLICQTFQSLFQKAYWGPENSDNAFVALAWKSFAKALGESCRKEVIPSQETVECITSLLDLCRSIWQLGPTALNANQATDTSVFCKRFHFLIKTMVLEIGIIPFVEPAVTQLEDGSLVPSEPQTSKANSPIMTPVVYLLLMMHSAKAANNIEMGDANLENVTQELLSSFVDSRATTATDLHFFRTTLTQMIEANNRMNNASDIKGLHMAILKLTQKVLGSPAKIQTVIDADMGSVGCADVVGILKLSVDVDDVPPTLWRGVLRSIVGSVKVTKGPKASVVEVLEPLADILCASFSPGSTLHMAEIVRLFAESKDSWLISSKTAKLRSKKSASNTNVNESVVGALSVHLLKCYETSTMSDVLVINSMVDATSFFIRQCPRDQVIGFLTAVEAVLSKWFQDPEEQLDGVHDLPSAKRSSARILWSAVIGRLFDNNEPDMLIHLEQLFVAAFTSPQRDVVNMAVERWNVTYGDLETIVYPESLKASLIRLRAHVDLQLPGLEATELDETTSSPPRFKESHDDYISLPSNQSRRQRSVTPNLAFTKSPSIASVFRHSDHNDKMCFSTPVRSKVPRKQKPRTQRPHDDSQLQFTSIASSPPNESSFESQFMTDHQKEVKDRQQRELAATFVDLRSKSSHEVKTRRSESTDIPAVFAGKTATSPSTPEILQIEGADLDEHVMSSPTPRSAHKDHVLNGVDFPSSPVDDLPMADTADALLTPQEDFPKSVLEASIRLQETIASGAPNSNNEATASNKNGSFAKSTAADHSIEGMMTSNVAIDIEEDRPDIELPHAPDVDVTDLFNHCGSGAGYSQQHSLTEAERPLQTKFAGFEHLSTTVSAPVNDPRLDRIAKSPGRPESDDFDSQIGLQLSQEIEYYADSDETGSHDRKFRPEKDTISVQNTPSTGTQVPTRSSRRRRRRQGVESSSSTPSMHKELGDTIVVDLEPEGTVSSIPATSGMKRKSKHVVDHSPHPVVSIADEMDGTPSKKAKVIGEVDAVILQVDELPTVEMLEAPDLPQAKTTTLVKKAAGLEAQFLSVEGAQGLPGLMANATAVPEAASHPKHEGSSVSNTEGHIIASLNSIRQQLDHSTFAISREGLRTIADLLFEIRSVAEGNVKR